MENEPAQTQTLMDAIEACYQIPGEKNILIHIGKRVIVGEWHSQKWLSVPSGVDLFSPVTKFRAQKEYRTDGISNYTVIDIYI